MKFGAALLLLVVAVVWPAALSGPFQFDDWNVIVEQPAVHSITGWWASMPGIRPLLKLSYAIDWQAGGQPFAFHLTNLLLHAANVLLAWRLCSRWPGLPPARAEIIAWWAALIFALHPVQAEAIAYVSGRSMSLMAFFWLAAALCWLKAAEGTGQTRGEPADADPRTGFKLAALLLFLAALAVRETAITLPVVLWLWQRAAGASWRAAFAQLRLMWAVLAGGVLLLLSLAGYRRLLGFSLDLRSPLANLTQQVDGLAYLLTRPLLLLQTNIDPDLTLHPVGSELWLLGAGGLLALLGGGFHLLRCRPLAGLALLWPLASLLPTNTLIPRLDLVADRHLYLALLGPAVLLARMLDLPGGAGGGPEFGGVRKKGLALGTMVAVGVVLGAATSARLQDFSSETALWKATAEASPAKARVWNNLGYGLLAEGDPGRARECFLQTLRLDPRHPKAQVNLQRAEVELRANQDASRR